MKETFNEMRGRMLIESDPRWRIRHCLWEMRYGPERRKLLLAFIAGGLKIRVNHSYCPLMRYDKDLQRLMKDGKIKLSRGSHETYLELK